MLRSCDTMVPPGEATAHGQTLFAKNSDRPADECQPLVQRYRQAHPLDAVTRCQFVELRGRTGAGAMGRSRFSNLTLVIRRLRARPGPPLLHVVWPVEVQRHGQGRTKGGLEARETPMAQNP